MEETNGGSKTIQTRARDLFPRLRTGTLMSELLHIQIETFFSDELRAGCAEQQE